MYQAVDFCELIYPNVLTVLVAITRGLTALVVLFRNLTAMIAILLGFDSY
jgi:hypothetical protein